jgi:hypothetical protein
MSDGPVEMTGIGVTPTVMRRLDRLRAVFGKSRSWVVEYVLTHGGLDGVEEAEAGQVQAFNALATKNGHSWEDYAFWYSATFSSRTYPPRVADIEYEADIEAARRAARAKKTPTKRTPAKKA